MAQFVKYREDNVTFEQGPFVAVEMPGWNKWRVEVEMKGHHCPATPDFEISRLLELNGRIESSRFPQAVECSVNWLNGQVREGNIVLKDERWWGVK